MNNPKLILENFVLRKIRGYSFLVPLNNSPDALLIINSSATNIWDNLNKGFSIKKTAGIMSEKTGISQLIIEGDINKFISSLSNGKFKNIKSIEAVNSSIKQARSPFRGSIELTGKCNLECVHCYARGERENKDLSFKKLEKILNEVIGEGCMFLQLTGGEVFSREDFGRIYLLIRRKGVIPTIMTNATLLDDNLLELLKDYPPLRVTVSLYGSNDRYHEKITGIKGSFRKTLDGIIRLRDAGINVWINAIVMKENFSDVASINSLANEIKIPTVFYPFLIPTVDRKYSPLSHGLSDSQCVEVLKYNNSGENLNKNREIKAKGAKIFPCSAGMQNFHIDSEGNLFICKIERNAGLPLLEIPFKRAWGKLLETRERSLAIPEKCLNCENNSICKMCPVLISLYDSVDDQHSYCRRLKIREFAGRN